jgi:hypothetical protein
MSQQDVSPNSRVKHTVQDDEVWISLQDVSRNSRVSQADQEAGILNGEIWMDAVDDLGPDYEAIAKMYAPRVGDLEFNPDRARTASALRRYRMAKVLVFYDDASVRLEKLRGACDPQERACTLLEILRRSLDVAPVYRTYGWRLLEVDPDELRAELQEIGSKLDPSTLRQVGIVPAE